MKGVVTKLCGFDSVEIPEELLCVCIDGEQIDRELQSLSLRYAQQTPVQTAQKGDIVYCTADIDSYPDKRDIILYTALNIPGAEDAAEAVLAKSVGDSFDTVLNGKNVKLSVKKVIRLFPAEINDELISSLKIDGVETVEDYRVYIEAKRRADAETEQRKMAVNEVMDQIVAGSEFEYDEADADEYIEDNLDEIEADYRDSDMELPPMDELRAEFIENSKRYWVSEEYCRINNIAIDRTQAAEEADRMIEMMTLMGERVPEREQMIEEAIGNACAIEFYRIIDKFVEEKMGR